MIEWVEDNKDEVLDKFGKGGFHVTEVLAGVATGWLTAFALKTFGKIVVTSLGGGLLLIQLAHNRGYVVVNYNKIYDDIQLDSPALPTVEEEAPEQDQRGIQLGTMPRTGSRFDFLRRWSVNTYSIIGFVGGFAYKAYY